MKRTIRTKMLFFTVLVLSAIAANSNASDKESSSTRHASVFSEYRQHQGVLQGWNRIEHRWMDVPRRKASEKSDPSTLAELSKFEIIAASPPPKSEILFSESFEVDSCPHHPESPLFDRGPIWDSWDDSYDPIFGDGEIIWGATCARASGGQSSAWCRKWKRLCRPQDSSDPDSTAWNYLEPGESIDISEYIENELMMVNSVDWPDYLPATLKMDVYPDFNLLQYSNGNYYDWLEVLLYDPETGYSHMLASILEPAEDWLTHSIVLPSEATFGSSFQIIFAYTGRFDLESFDGAFIDEISIFSQDTDLVIASAFDDGGQFSTDDPVTVTVTIRNDGSDPSSPSSLAYVQNCDLPSPYEEQPQYTGVVPVPEIPPMSSVDVSVLIDYAAGAGSKAAGTIITHDLSFRIDPDHEIPETDEYNNDLEHCATATWNVMLPPVVLIHGYMGGGLVKDGDPVYEENLLKTVHTMTLGLNRIARDGTTNYEADGGRMTVPGAYYPECGFLRNVGSYLRNPLAGINTGLSRLPDIYIAQESSQNMWDPLIENLTQQYGYELEYDLFLFNYDWRKELNPERPLPDGLTPSVTRLDSLVHHIRDVVHHQGSERLTIISHSMGGLLTEAYLRSNPDDHGVFRWIALGVPFQGTVDAFSGLYSANAGPVAALPLFGDILSPTAARKTTGLVKNFVPHWELLPTPAFDDSACSIPGAWEGPEVFAEAGSYPANMRRISLPVYPQYTCDDIETNRNGCRIDPYDPEDPDELWGHNEDARRYSNDFQDDYLDMNNETMIRDVDTWLLVCPNLYTLRGVARYGKASRTWPSFISESLRYSTKYDAFFSSGDGTVPQWSAETVNVENVHTRYCASIRHREMVQNQGVADFLTAIVADEPLFPYDNDFPADPASIFDPSSVFDFSNGWLFEWRLDAAVWQYGGKGNYEELPVYPVSLELLDRETGQMLIGTTHLTSPEDPEGEVLPLVLNRRFKGVCLGQQILVGSHCMDHMSLRLVIRPSPEMFIPAEPPVAKSGAVPVDSDFIVLGQLALHDVDFTWLFPDLDLGETEFIEFNRLSANGSAYGFQAYVDFEIAGGDVLDQELHLVVDRDGDGFEDDVFTRVSEPGPPVSDSFLLTAHPNPFNPATEIRWRLPEANGESLVIYDVTGRPVRRYTLGGSREGSWIWDGRDDSGRDVASGVYFAVVQNSSSERLSTRKLTLVR